MIEAYAADMPELPEVEHVRRRLGQAIVSVRIEGVAVRRRGVIDGPKTPAALLAGGVIERIERHGKQLAIVTADGRAVGAHLGMSGQLLAAPGAGAVRGLTHAHVVWRLEGGGRMVFRDPRRFGGLWTRQTFEALREERWASMGPDALTCDARTLQRRLGGRRRAIKAALLDQSLVAGIGNIYADEALFRAAIHPETPTEAITRWGALSRAMRRTLTRAIEAGGSTLRDGSYVGPAGESGAYQRRHAVYGRGGEACLLCGAALSVGVVAQRTTVWCGGCQRMPCEPDPGGSSSRREERELSSSP